MDPNVTLQLNKKEIGNPAMKRKVRGKPCIYDVEF